MRLLFSQYRICAARDAAQPLSPRLQQKLAKSDELRRYAQSLSALDQELRKSVPQAEPSPALHASIMREVRTAARAATPGRRLAVLRWLPAPALATLLCALWVWHHASVPAQSRSALESASTALAASREMAQAAPVSALAPLTEEWQRLNKDLDNTAQFLLATLP
jgi:hypothetical protein